MRVVDIPPTAGANDFYVGNRPPLLPNPLIKLPIGSIRPEGWLRHQLESMATGFTGRLPELSRFCSSDTGWMTFESTGWEEVPYWLKGFGDLGYILGDERITNEARKWIDAALAHQDEDGYFGPPENKQTNDLWPNMIMLYVLRSCYEATGDSRVLPFMARYFRYQSNLPKEQLYQSTSRRGWWQHIRAGDNLDSIYWLYNRTGEAWLLDLARVNHERTADWTGGIASWHGVNICQCFREPAQYYQQSLDTRHLKATVRNYDEVMGTYGQVPGGMFGADENARPHHTGPRQAAETCSMVELMHSHEVLLTITGNPLWADRCEEIAFNSLPAAMTPDLKGLHYLTAPNMVQLDRGNKSPLLQNRGDMLSYNPRQYRCCQHNVAFGWPYLAEHLWMATRGNGLAAAFYADSKVRARVGDGTEVEITEKTAYPFGELIEFHISTGKSVRFPLLLRIPGWCEGATVRVDGEAMDVQSRPLSWVMLERLWQDGDTVRLQLPMAIRLVQWQKNKNAVSVYRGPLAYSLKIGERWERYGNSEEWPSYEVFPTTPWNYGLLADVNNPPSSFQVARREGPLAAQPFTPDAAPVQLQTKGKRIPQWKLEENGLIGALQESPVRSDETTEMIALIPIGCARLRVSAFPHIGDGPDAHVWNEPAPPPTASHCWRGDTVSALNDGVLPKSSIDRNIPRFTWWDHRGTREWVQYTFSEPRAISWCEVYWFDDTGVGKCRVPASWRVLWKKGETWQPVEGASEYGIKKDQFNRVTFDGVTITALRLEAQLQPEFSAGILEWRVEE